MSSFLDDRLAQLRRQLVPNLARWRPAVLTDAPVGVLAEQQLQVESDAQNLGGVDVIMVDALMELNCSSIRSDDFAPRLDAGDARPRYATATVTNGWQISGNHRRPSLMRAKTTKTR